MQAFGLISLLLAVALGVYIFTQSNDPLLTDSPEVGEEAESIDPVIQAEIDSHADLIQLAEPTPGASISSPLTIKGKARGNWFFEASFPVILTDWDGRIIAEHYATADGEWMTTEFVNFSTELTFSNPYQVGDPDFMRRGSLILKKDNPSGLPEHDDALEIPIYFKAAVSGTREVSSYGDAIDAAKEVTTQRAQ